jgi:hypothetical protein
MHINLKSNAQIIKHGFITAIDRKIYYGICPNWGRRILSMDKILLILKIEES